MSASAEPGGLRGEDGSVTAEFALGLPGVVATVLLVLGALVAGVTTVQCYEAARAGAREAMWAGSSAAAAAAHAVAGDRAAVTVLQEGEWVTVRVEKSLFLQGFPVRVSGQLSAPVESRSPPAGLP